MHSFDCRILKQEKNIRFRGFDAKVFHKLGIDLLEFGNTRLADGTTNCSSEIELPMRMTCTWTLKSRPCASPVTYPGPFGTKDLRLNWVVLKTKVHSRAA